MITTYTGLKVNPLNLQKSDIKIADIAHALALCNRFAGHTRFPISVAQHSFYASYLVSGTGYELQALLHDASEAYLGDVTSDLKHSSEMIVYRSIEQRTQRLIYDVFNCPEEENQVVKTADKLLAQYEHYLGFKHSQKLSQDDVKKVSSFYVTEWTWRRTESSFLQRFKQLFI